MVATVLDVDVDVDGRPFDEDLLNQLYRTPMHAPRFPSQFSGLGSSLFIVFFNILKNLLFILYFYRYYSMIFYNI